MVYWRMLKNGNFAYVRPHGVSCQAFTIFYKKKKKKRICHIIIIITYSKEMLKRDQGAPNCTCICMMHYISFLTKCTCMMYVMHVYWFSNNLPCIFTLISF